MHRLAKDVSCGYGSSEMRETLVGPCSSFYIMIRNHLPLIYNRSSSTAVSTNMDVVDFSSEATLFVAMKWELCPLWALLLWSRRCHCDQPICQCSRPVLPNHARVSTWNRVNSILLYFSRNPRKWIIGIRFHVAHISYQPWLFNTVLLPRDRHHTWTALTCEERIITLFPGAAPSNKLAQMCTTCKLRASRHPLPITPYTKEAARGCTLRCKMTACHCWYSTLTIGFKGHPLRSLFVRNIVHTARAHFSSIYMVGIHEVRCVVMVDSCALLTCSFLSEQWNFH